MLFCNAMMWTVINDVSVMTSGRVPSEMCAQQRFNSAYAFAQFDQNLRWVHFGAKCVKFPHATIKTLIRLCGCAG